MGRPGSRYSHYVLFNDPGNTGPESAVFGISALPSYTGARIPVATVNLLDPAVVRYFQGLFVSLVDPPGRERGFGHLVQGHRPMVDRPVRPRR